LKKSTLRFDSEMVTFSTFSFTTNSLGGGRKSSTILMAPIGPFVYLICLLIDCLTFGPVACPEYPDDAIPIREAYGQDATAMTAEAVMALFLGGAVFDVFGQDAPLIEKGTLGVMKADTVLSLIGAIFARVPFEGCRQHGGDASTGMAIAPYFCMAIGNSD
jgi:hypothetical protein